MLTYNQTCFLQLLCGQLERIQALLHQLKTDQKDPSIFYTVNGSIELLLKYILSTIQGQNVLTKL